MLRRLILVSGLIAAGTLGFAGRASAQATDQTATFTGGVSGTCEIGGGTNDDLTGVIEANGTQDEFTSTEDVTVNVNCAGGNLNVTDITKDNGATDADVTVTVETFDGQRFDATLDGGTTTLTSTGVTLTADDTGDATVSMTAVPNGGGTFAADNYTFSVILTVTPAP